MKRVRDLPSLDLLKGFESAARHLSFTKAAEELFVTQSAISRQIRTLEQHLHVELFHRGSRALQLTDAGRLLLQGATRIFEALDQTVARITADEGVQALTVTTTVSFASMWLVPRLPRFREMHPEVDVRIAATNSTAHLERQQIDLAVRMLDPATAGPAALPLADELVLPVCSPQLLKDRSRPVRSPHDLQHHVLLHFDEAADRWPLLTWQHWLRQSGVPDLRPVGSIGFSHYEHVIQAAIAGQGIALGRTPLVNDLLTRKTLGAPFPDRRSSGRAYFVLLAQGSEHRPPVLAFMHWLRSEIRDQT